MREPTQGLIIQGGLFSLLGRSQQSVKLTLDRLVCSLNTYCVSACFLGTGNTVVSKMDQSGMV